MAPPLAWILHGLTVIAPRTLFLYLCPHDSHARRTNDGFAPCYQQEYTVRSSRPTSKWWLFPLTSVETDKTQGHASSMVTKLQTQSG